MSQQDTAHAWWSRLRHQGLLLSPVVMLERFPAAPEPAPFHVKRKAAGRPHPVCFHGRSPPGRSRELEQSAILAWTDALLENYVGHGQARLAKQHNIPDNLTAVVRIGTRSDTIRPHRVVFADDEGKTPALLVMADTSPHRRSRAVAGRLTPVSSNCCVAPATAWACSPTAINSGWSMRASISSRGASGRATAGSMTAKAPRN